jgi:hypothetical protein
MAACAQMWQRKMFTENQMVTWENKMPANQTWQIFKHTSPRLAQKETVLGNNIQAILFEGG